MTLKVVHTDTLSTHKYCRSTRTIELNEAMVHTDRLSKPARAMDLRTTPAGHLSASGILPPVVTHLSRKTWDCSRRPRRRCPIPEQVGDDGNERCPAKPGMTKKIPDQVGDDTEIVGDDELSVEPHAGLAAAAGEALEEAFFLMFMGMHPRGTCVGLVCLPARDALVMVLPGNHIIYL